MLAAGGCVSDDNGSDTGWLPLCLQHQHIYRHQHTNTHLHHHHNTNLSTHSPTKIRHQMQNLLSTCEHILKLPAPLPEAQAASFFTDHPLDAVFQCVVDGSGEAAADHSRHSRQDTHMQFTTNKRPCLCMHTHTIITQGPEHTGMRPTPAGHSVWRAGQSAGHAAR